MFFLMRKPKINIVSLGCSKNTVDSETLAGKLISNNFSVEFDIEKPSFDFVIINTCGFIDKAKEESIDTILSFVEMREEKHKTFKIIVYGCLAQRYKEDLIQEIPEIDLLCGIMADQEIINYILSVCKSDNNQKTNKTLSQRKLSSVKHFAYVKIAEGCNRKCSFCAIPLIKGPYNIQLQVNLTNYLFFIIKKNLYLKF